VKEALGNNVESITSKIESKQLTIEILDSFILHTKHEYGTTHKKLCYAKIERIYRRVLEGYRFGGIKISNNELIIDGNHRYIAYKLAEIEFDVIKAGRNFSDEIRKINDIEIDKEHDWDYNCHADRKYCTDEFLSDPKYNKE